MNTPYFVRERSATAGAAAQSNNTAPTPLVLPSMSPTPSHTRVVVLLLISLTVGCRSESSVSSQGRAFAPQRRGEPLQLERLQVGSVYGIGSRFKSDQLEFVVEGFGEGLGNAEVGRVAQASAQKPSKTPAAKTLLLSHATLRCSASKISHLEFDFIDNGGPVALEISGKTHRAADFIELDGLHLGAAQVAVTEANTAGVRHGRVVVTGALTKFAISGADLELVDVRLER